MGSLLLASSVAFAASLFLTVAVRAAARRWKIVDRPDGQRKLHGWPVPLCGGVAVYAAMILGLLAVRFGASGAMPELRELSTAWIIAAGFVCFVGSVDDLFNLYPRLKLALQIVSVLPIVAFGYYVDRIVAFGYPIELGWLGIPLTVLWLVGCINALNLIDGMDGLASIVGLSTATMLGVIAASEGHHHVALMAVVLAGSLAGFLMYNLPPASIFLGDSGSMVIGLTIGVLGIQGSMKTSATLAITAPAVVMTLPMFDILAAVVRRKLTGRRFDAPDRLHIHHRLLERGWTPWQVLSLIGALCLAMGAAATAATIFRRDALAWIAAMTLVVLLIRLKLFGYEEFALAKHSAAGFLGRFSRRVHAAHAWPPAPTVNRTPHPAELWDTLLRDMRGWNIRQVELTLSRGQAPRRLRWIDPAAPIGEECRWSVAVSLPGRDGDLCELRVASAAAIASEDELSALTLLLRTVGAQFAIHGEQILGPLTIADEPLPAETRRKAA
jgi:UDP-GlcNAc:undecaprenyl-phosphate GlcNAc-1-phosphate transferase